MQQATEQEGHPGDAGAADDGVITQSELLRHLRGYGHDVSADQLTRWHKQDCVPRPKLLHMSRLRGSVSCYPIHAVSQTLEVCRLWDKKRYSFDELRVLLWIAGYPIPPERVQVSLRSLIERIRDELHQRTNIRTVLRDTLAAAEQLTTQWLPALARSAFKRLAGRQLSAQDWESYLTMQFQLLMGGKPAFESGDEYVTGDNGEPIDRPLAQLVIDAWGVNRAQTDRLGEAKPWLPLNITPTLIDLARRRILSLQYALDTIERATPDQIAQALIDRQVLFVEFPELVRGVESLFDEGAFGFGMFRALVSLVPRDDATYQAMQIVAMLGIRRSGYGPSLDQVSAAIRPVVPIFKRYKALLEAFERELPDYAAELLPYRTPITNQGGDLTPYLNERLSRIRKVAARHKDELDAFCKRHPEFSVDLPEAPMSPGHINAAQA